MASSGRRPETAGVRFLATLCLIVFRKEAAFFTSDKIRQNVYGLTVTTRLQFTDTNFPYVYTERQNPGTTVREMPSHYDSEATHKIRQKV